MTEDEELMCTRKRLGQSYRRTFWTAMTIWIALLLGLLLCSSCRSIQYVPVETIRTEIQNHHDTVLIQDTVKNDVQTVIREADSAEIDRLNKEFGFKLNKANKTILILRKELEQKSHEQTEVKSDTVIKEKEVKVPYPVEKKLTRWQQVKIDWGGEAIIVVIVVFFILVWLIVKHLRR